MPCNIPAHIFDIDDATAERLTRRSIRRRQERTAAVTALVVFAAILSFAAIF